MTWQDKLERYDAIVGKCDGIERKGKTVPYTSANGHMFSLLNKEGELGFRFSKEVQQRYIEEFKSDVLRSHGAQMRGYVRIPESLFNDLNKLTELLKESHAYVMSLEPK